jgi:hypothetical protein
MDKSESKRSFQLLRNITKLDQFEKREGSIVSIAKDNEGKLLTGD